MITKIIQYKIRSFVIEICFWTFRTQRYGRKELDRYCKLNRYKWEKRFQKEVLKPLNISNLCKMMIVWQKWKRVIALQQEIQL